MTIKSVCSSGLISPLLDPGVDAEKGSNKIESKIIKICKYLEFEENSFEAFLKWVLNLRKDLNIPHKLSEVNDEKDFDLDRLSKLALDDPSTGGNPKKLNLNDMKIMYQHSMSGELFK